MTNIDRGVTAERARGLLSYEPATGVFTRRVSRGGYVAGTIAGNTTGRGYVYISIDCRQYQAHRLAWLYMTAAWPAHEIDHINSDPSDNRWQNLREATRSQNLGNQRIGCTNKSGFKGVSWAKNEEKWVARISVNGKSKHLGYFDSAERAFIEYMFEAWRLFGDYARIDAAYLKEIRERKARKGWQRDVLWNLANPNPKYMAA